MKLFSLILSLTCFSAFAATVIPFERDIPRTEKYVSIFRPGNGSPFFERQFGIDSTGGEFFCAFSLMNYGPNVIVTEGGSGTDFPNREFLLMNDDHSRRETYLWVTDYIGSGITADYFETILFFLPRENQMYVEESADELLVTLTTGEEVTFLKKPKIIASGVLKELPVDFEPNRALRSHARISYQGKGLMIRSDSKGSDPRLTQSVQILKGSEKPCTLPAKLFWTQENFPKFKFVNDADAYAVIREKCGANYIP